MSNKQTLDDIKYEIACGDLTAPEVYGKMLQLVDKLQKEKNKTFYRAVFDVTLGVALGWVIMMIIMHIN